MLPIYLQFKETFTTDGIKRLVSVFPDRTARDLQRTIMLTKTKTLIFDVKSTFASISLLKVDLSLERNVPE